MTRDDTDLRVLAIDGPAGAGKSMVSRRVAAELGYAHLDTGAMYRAVTLACLRAGLRSEPLDEDRVATVVRDLTLTVDADERVWLNGTDVTDSLRGPEVDGMVSAVSAIRAVREAMVRLQRQVARDMVAAGRGLVVDGRDIGSVVFPHARHRYYLDASLEERARRRRRAAGDDAPLADWMDRLSVRDAKDSGRALSPLHAAPGATCIDTTDMTEDEVVSTILEAVRT